jgi:hypothetical protein
MRYVMFISCFLITILTGCVEDEPVVRSTEAVLRSRFIPVDSVVKLRVLLELNQLSRASINDDLERIDSLENAGDPRDFSEIKTLLSVTLDSLQKASSEYSTITNRIAQGNIELDYITAEGGETLLRFDNPQEVYGLPLNSQATETTFEIGYGSYRKNASARYTIDTLFDENRVRLRGINLSVINDSFDSVKYFCDSICTTDEANIIFYF